MVHEQIPCSGKFHDSKKYTVEGVEVRTKHGWDGVPGMKEYERRLGHGCGKLHEHVMQTPDGLRGREEFHSSQKRQKFCRTLTSHHLSRLLKKIKFQSIFALYRFTSRNTALDQFFQRE